MIRATIIEEKDMDKIQEFLERIDVAIGSTINFKEDPQTVRDNMIDANRCLYLLKDLLGIEF